MALQPMSPDVSPAFPIDPPDSGDVRRHLEKILASRAFSNAPRAQRFLRFAIEETLAGHASDIKEPLVAARVFNLGDFDRQKNSIVRTEATHVRRRLRDYYRAAGGSDSVVIDLPKGGYKPLIRTVAASEGKPPVARSRLPGIFARWRTPGP